LGNVKLFYNEKLGGGGGGGEGRGGGGGGGGEEGFTTITVHII